ncbi:MAG: hypothetical protein Q4B08_13460 [Propionibacteriaceae bacterium]|nr:hypothetical protein [Propionibacteriaceae bacterium]
MSEIVRRSALERGLARIIGFLLAIPAGILIGWIGGQIVKIAVG